MKKILLILLFIGLLKGYAAHLDESSLKKKSPGPSVVPDIVVFKLKDKKSLNKSNSINIIQKASAYGISRVTNAFQSYEYSNFNNKTEFQTFYYAHFDNFDPREMAKKLAKDPSIQFAEPLYIHQICRLPNDSLLNRQNHLNIINAPQAWDLATNDSSGIIVAVVDGGTEMSHPDLKDNLWVNPDEIANNGIDDDQNGFIDDIHGWNFANNSADPIPIPGLIQNGRHGTHTAGIICAVTNNQTGVAGVSWNAKLMAINASSPSSDNAIQGGYRGILYAGNNGAKIINCSWGALGVKSEYEQWIINKVTEIGAVVVAAAGNNNQNIPHYPSAYRHVLSVAATNDNDTKFFRSNYGNTIDVAAPGLDIWSTVTNETYGISSGTSMASPIVAGVIALVGGLHPDWTGVQMAEQVRVTADNIDAKNPSHVGQLGKGRVNAFRALTEEKPAIRLESFEFFDQTGDSIIDPGDNVEIYITIQNYLQPVNTLKIRLVENYDFITVSTPTIKVGSIGSMEQSSITTPFLLNIASDAPKGESVEFKLETETDNYMDFDIFNLIIKPLFESIGVNNINTSITPIGRFGFADSENQEQGYGFSYKESANLMFEGAIIAGTSPTQISNAARGTLVRQQLRFDQDFDIAENGDIRVRAPGNLTDEETIARFNDSKATNPMNIEIKQETFAQGFPPFEDIILYRYTILNTGSVLENFHFGLFFDWDMSSLTAGSNVAGYEPTLKMGHVHDTSDEGPKVYAGVQLLSDIQATYRAIYNDQDHPDNQSWGLYDGFSDQEKWQAISAGTIYTTAGPADISNCLSAGPLVIQQNESISLTFALLGGENLDDMKQNANAARQLFDEIENTRVKQDVVYSPERFLLEQNHPNPFNPQTSIHYQLPEGSDVELTIYNIMGQKIKTLVDTFQISGYYSVSWDGLDEVGTRVPTGTYIYKLKAGDFMQKRKMLLLK